MSYLEAMQQSCAFELFSETTPGFLRDHTLAAAPILINHQVWRCTIASVCALIVIGVAAVFGAVYTQTSAVGLRQLEAHLDAALPVNRSKEVCSSSRQCGLDDNSVRFTAAMEVGVSISLRAGFMRAQVGTIWRSIDTSFNPNQHSELSHPKHHFSQHQHWCRLCFEQVPTFADEARLSVELVPPTPTNTLKLPSTF